MNKLMIKVRFRRMLLKKQSATNERLKQHYMNHLKMSKHRLGGKYRQKVSKWRQKVRCKRLIASKQATNICQWGK